MSNDKEWSPVFKSGSNFLRFAAEQVLKDLEGHNTYAPTIWGDRPIKWRSLRWLEEAFRQIEREGGKRD